MNLRLTSRLRRRDGNLLVAVVALIVLLVIIGWVVFKIWTWIQVNKPAEPPPKPPDVTNGPAPNIVILSPSEFANAVAAAHLTAPPTTWTVYSAPSLDGPWQAAFRLAGPEDPMSTLRGLIATQAGTNTCYFLKATRQEAGRATAIQR